MKIVAEKQSYFLWVSALAYYCLFIKNYISIYPSILVAAVIMAFVVRKIPPVRTIWKDSPVGSRIFAVMSSVGICLAARDLFLSWWGVNTKTLIASTAGMVVGMYFVAVCVLLFFWLIKDSFTELCVLQNITRLEYVIYTILLFAGFAATVIMFHYTDAFYGTVHDCDIIYTSDSPFLVKHNVYMDLNNPENDIRQPLFTVFAAPFLGIPYLLGRLLGESVRTNAIALNCGQIVLLFAGNFLLAKAMGLTKGKRIGFMIASCCTYTQLLFSVMMEQYIVSFFWLMLCVYQICKKNKLDSLVLWGAGGTLLTSMILIPAVSPKHPAKQFKTRILDILKCGLGFLILILALCRFAVFYNMAYSVSMINRFTGQKIAVADKVYQYTEFVKNYFVAPKAGVNWIVKPFASWQLEPITALNWVGIGILLLVVVSAVWNRKNKSSRMAALWVGFSVVMLLILGWGTAENGLILYSLYFGWAFLVLLFQLVDKIENTLHIKHLTVICSIVASAVLLMFNIPAMMEMIKFAIEYYPI